MNVLPVDVKLIPLFVSSLVSGALMLVAGDVKTGMFGVDSDDGGPVVVGPAEYVLLNTASLAPQIWPISQEPR